MKRKLFLFVFLVFSLLVAGAGKELYYIVDGIPGVPFDQLPPAEEIASQKEVDPEEAAYIYGDRAANGAVIISTKEYARKQAEQYKQSQAREERKAREAQERVQQEKIAKQIAIQRQKEHQKKFIIVLWIGSVIMAFILFLLFRKSKTSLKEALLIAQNESYKQTIRNERFYITGSFRYYATIIFCLFIAVLMAFLLRLDYTSEQGSIVYSIILVLIEGLGIYHIIEYVTHLWQCYLEVDDEGIRGVYAEYLFVEIQYIGIDIRWEEVASAKVIDVPFGKTTVDRLVFYSDEDCQTKIDSALLVYFPTSEITAQINRFYARFSGKRLIK